MKYKLTDEKMEYYGRTLHRIQALKDFGLVEAGDLGGWIQSEANLSQDGSCWVAHDAKVFGNAWISDNALVSNNAWVSDNAHIYGNAQVSDDTWVYGNAQVFGDARLSDNARVYGNAQIKNGFVG